VAQVEERGEQIAEFTSEELAAGDELPRELSLDEPVSPTASSGHDTLVEERDNRSLKRRISAKPLSGFTGPIPRTPWRPHERLRPQLG